MQTLTIFSYYWNFYLNFSWICPSNCDVRYTAQKNSILETQSSSNEILGQRSSSYPIVSLPFKSDERSFATLHTLFLFNISLLFLLNISSSVPAKLVCFSFGRYPKRCSLPLDDLYLFNGTTNRSSLP